MNKEQPALKQDIGLFFALSLVIGTIIGSGVFMKPGNVLSYSGSSDIALFAWLLGGILTLAGGLTVAEIGTQIPRTGGLYAYLEEVYGEFWGYLCGWVQIIIYGPAIIGALGLYFGSLLANLFSLSSLWSTTIGIITVLFLCLINIMGTKYGGFVQGLTTIGKLVPIAAIIVFGLWKGNENILMAVNDSIAQMNFGAAILATLFAYDGWILLAALGGEMKNPEKLLPRAMAGGILIVTACYLFINVALLHVLPADQIVQLGENATSTAATMLFGPIGGKVISIGIIISIFGCLNGKVLSFPRVIFAMAERKQIPFANAISRIHPTFKTPWIAVFVQILIAIVFMIVSNPEKLSEVSIFMIYIFYVMAFFAVFKLRKQNKGIERAYSVPLYPLTPIVAIIGSLFVLISTMITDWKSCLISMLIGIAGLPLYYYMKRAHKKAER
ncbi:MULTISPECIES: APC family permease [Bacillus]|uniref:Serine/threonine protein kinase n=3 Tax=Bacillus pumilus TaxID=1408 RepID=A8FC96_BACP2|nr:MULTISPECIES: amino acid permease [Bacillus]ABV61863.1 serine/threonine protein kinase [Bacillus pumilus SAFR-032]MBC3642573.1 amino acid permease [Bacillus pumilus]MBC3646744.1 amino acid permease [Bacillus pumilus]MBC3650378.1 amino acid permease [Bacillus pumilus]MBC3653404.1 amino acid permease [Bacillus pumilus]